MGKTYVQGEVLNATDLNASFLELKTLPINPQTSTYTLVVDDLGKVISATGSINIPASVFASGSTVSIFNNSSAVINIIQAAGLTLYNASTSVAGSFTLNSRGICSVIFVNTTTAVLTGVGVSVTASGTLQGPVGPAGSFGTISAGSAAAPSIAPAADTNTGMFFPAADTIAFAEGGTEAMRIDSGGNVLVGTTSTLGNALFVSRVGIAARSVAGDGIIPYIQSYNGNAGTDLKTWRLGTHPSGHLSIETVNDAYTSAAERLRIASAGQIGIGGANYGTSGQVLTSGGASAAPSWTTVSASASGGLIRAPQVLTSGTSYTTPAGCTAIIVEAVGGGGGAGSSSTAIVSGGGGGAYVKKYFTVTASTPYTYAIGAGGAGRAAGAGAGAAGGSSTFTVGATTVTAGGGNNGENSSITVTGGSATNGDLNVVGGRSIGTGTGISFGGSSMYGVGGPPGSAGTGFGAGGGASQNNPGGNGTNGVIIISEYS